MALPPPPTGLDVIERATVFKGYFRIDRYVLRHGLFDGGWTAPMTREVFERGHASAVLPFDPERGEAVLCQQFRVGALAGGLPPWQVELVAGIIDDGETPEAVARREAREEAGLTVTDLMPICRYAVSPGGASESVYLYLGRVSAAGAGGVFGLADEGEHIRVEAVPEIELRRMLDAGEIGNASTLLAVQWLFLNRDKVRAAWGGV
ncbi:MAG: NUDIX domain-containing protein [Rhodospirillaceae bacterium]|nr:NUDIX domain-containing protein [Rhodospirillaceae bacterium]